MKKNISQDRLKSAVQFKFQEVLRPSMFNTTRLQTGTTTSRNHEEVSKTQMSEQRSLRAFRRVSSQISLDRPKEDSQPNQSVKGISTERTPMRMSQKLIVTSENIQTPEVKRRMKFDPFIRQQVSLIRVKCLKNQQIKRFLLFLLSKEKTFFELLRLKQIPQAIDILQNIIEMAIGTKICTLFVDVLLFVADVLDNVGQMDLAIHFYNQVRILCTLAKQTLDLQKMKAFVGLANCCISSQQYDLGVKFLKKCLQYAWFNNNSEYENIAYSKMGISYFYLGNISKAIFYHERSINYDYELEESPLRQLSCDTLKNYLNKHFPYNYATSINNTLLSKLSLKMPINLEAFNDELQRCQEFTPSPRLFLNSQDCSRRMSISMELRELANLKIDGQRLIRDILNQQEFDFEVYTPKHSFRTESKCFSHLKNKKSHPQDEFHDPKYNQNTFVLDDLGVMRNKNILNFAEYLSKYKLTLEKKIDIRLQQNFDVNIEQKLQFAASRNNKMIEKRNKILLTHQNQENSRKNKQLIEAKQLTNANMLFQNLVSKLLTN